MEGKKTKISLIIPIYNVAQYLDRCMQSVLNQTIEDIEIIMVDDGSPDICPTMCDEYCSRDSRIKVVHKENGGLGYARNSGLDIATGEYVAFVDSDDFIADDMFDTLYKVAISNNLDIVYCGFNKYKNGKVVGGRSEESQLTIYEGIRCEDVLQGMVSNNNKRNTITKYEMSVWHAIYKRHIIENNNIRFCSEREFISEDIIFHIDILNKCKKIGFIPNRLYYYCYNDESLTKSYRKERLGRHLTLFEEIDRRIKANGYAFAPSKTSNLFLLKLRYDFTIIGNYGFSFTKVKNLVTELAYDKRLAIVMKHISFEDVPLKYKLFFFLVNNKWINTLTLLIKK